VNVDVVAPKIGVRIMQFLSQLGHYKLANGRDDFAGTTKMIDQLAEHMKTTIPNLSTLEKVDLGIALMIVPIKPALMLANLCFENISEIEFLAGCNELTTSTDYFEIYGNTIGVGGKADFCIDAVF